MGTRIISLLLTITMICCTTFLVKADQVKIKKSRKDSGGVRSISLDPSHLTVNLDNNVIHVDFFILLRDVNISIVSSDGRPVYQQVISPQTSSVDIDLCEEEPGVYTVYFTDATGICLFGEFVLSQITYKI